MIYELRLTCLYLHTGRYRGYKYKQVSLSLSITSFFHIDILQIKIYESKYCIAEGIQPHTSTNI
jgi:hypothetical protein